MVTKEIIDDFFNRYASVMNNALFGDIYDINAIRNSFSDFVVSANPLGVAGGRDDEQFVKGIRRGIDFYKNIGIVSMNITSKEIFIMDEFHAIVTVCWTSLYEKENSFGEIHFQVVHLVQCQDGLTKIFAYVRGDEQAAFKTHNLLVET